MRRTLALATLTLLVTALPACGGDHGGADAMNHDGSEKNRPVAAGAREIPVNANRLTFTPKTIQLRAGESAAIVLTSKDLEHDFYVKGVGHVVSAAAGETARGGLTIEKPGTYAFWCTVSGHRAGGMEGTITVVA